MGEQINEVLMQFYLLILNVCKPIALLYLALGVLKQWAGEEGAIVRTLRQAGLGLLVIVTAKTFVWLVVEIATATASIGW